MERLPAANIFEQHYDTRVKQLEYQVRQGNRAGVNPDILLIGDSITEGLRRTNLFPDSMRVQNAGIGGDTLISETGRGLLPRLTASRLSPGSPADIFLMMGVNDLRLHNRDVGQVAAQYDKALEALGSNYPDAQVHVLSVLPTTGESAALNPRIQAFNALVRGVAAAKGLDFIDAHAHVVGPDGEMPAGKTDDGLHPNISSQRDRSVYETIVGLELAAAG